tara:strand:+ start:53 stop:193 length:141 start_codon:yes stop_codon:yes gene_type:complete
MMKKNLLDIVSSQKARYLFFCWLCDNFATPEKKAQAKGASASKAQA